LRISPEKWGEFCESILLLPFGMFPINIFIKKI